jgi:hypothetical protein
MDSIPLEDAPTAGVARQRKGWKWHVLASRSRLVVREQRTPHSFADTVILTDSYVWLTCSASFTVQNLGCLFGSVEVGTKSGADRLDLVIAEANEASASQMIHCWTFPVGDALT